MKSKKITGALAALAVLLACFLTACGGTKNYQEKILGSWGKDGERVISFYDDGTCDIAGDYGLGKWSIGEANDLEFKDYYGRQVFKGSIEGIQGDEMTLTAEDGESQFELTKLEDSTTSGEETQQTDYETKILGTWYHDGSEIVTFYSDNTCKIAGNYGLGTWAVVNGGLLNISDAYGQLMLSASIDKLDANTLQLNFEDTQIEYTRAEGQTPVLLNLFTQKDYASEILGTWYVNGNKAAAFYSDGTCEINGSYSLGRWAVVNGNVLKFVDALGDLLFAGPIEKLDRTTLSIMTEDGEDHYELTRPDGSGQQSSEPATTANEENSTSSVTGANKADGDGVIVDSSTFPDEGFREYVQQRCDTNGDGTLDEQEIEAVTEIVFDGEGYGSIERLTGLEYFTNLKKLDLNDQCYPEELDVSHNEKLEYLQCACSGQNKLDLSHNPKLLYLECSENALGTLDLSHNPELVVLSCGQCELTELDVSKNTKLEKLSCENNLITELDLSHNPELVILNCASEALKTLNLSNNTISLTVQDIYDIQNFLAGHSTTLMADGHKLPCVCLD